MAPSYIDFELEIGIGHGRELSRGCAALAGRRGTGNDALPV